MAVVNQYLYPVGGTTPPSAIQALGVQAVYAQIVWGDTDTSALITHNFGVIQPNITPYSGGVAGTPVAATAVFPVVIMSLDASSTGTVATTYSYSNLNSVAISVKKASVAGSNSTLNFTILRPYSEAFQ